MKIEIRKNHAVVNETKVDKERVLEMQEYGVRTSRRIDYKLDLRKRTKGNITIIQTPEVEIRNKSGHNITVVGINDAAVGLKTSQGVKVRNGILECISQYPIE